MKLIENFGKVIKLFTDEEFRLRFFATHGFAENISGEKILKVQYRKHFGKELNLENPSMYTEKLQWLKLYDHRPEYTTMVDKYLAKQYVAERIGEEYIVPLIAVWDKAEDIDFERLPEQFVLKTTHDSGGIVVCKNKKDLDQRAAREKLANSLKTNYWVYNREWPYKHVTPRIIAEAYMEDTKYGELRDYKFFTFGGEPKVMYIAKGRGLNGETTADFFDMEYNHMPFTIDHDMAEVMPEKPQNFEKMIEFAKILSKGTPQLRVDFYEVDGKLYFGEMTFFHCSGMNPFHPEEWDRRFGEWVELPEKRGINE